MDKRKLLSFVLALILTAGLLPMQALAASDPPNYTFDISEGDITINNGGSAGTVRVTYGGSPQTTTPDFPNTQQ